MPQRAFPLPSSRSFPRGRSSRGWGTSGWLAVVSVVGLLAGAPIAAVAAQVSRPESAESLGAASVPAGYGQLGELRFQAGDDLRWAEPEWDDSDWQLRTLVDPPRGQGQLWARLVVSTQEGPVWGLQVTAAAAREVYWDGVLIGRAGRVGPDRASEVAGPIDAVFPVPQDLQTAGEHVVAVRFSNFLRADSTRELLLNIELADLRTLTAAPYRKLAVPILFLGGYVLVAFYYGALFLAGVLARRRRMAHLWTALLCLSVAGLLVAEGWRQVFGYPYPLHGLRLGIIEFLTWLIALLLGATLSVSFRLASTRGVLALLTLGGAGLLFGIEDHETSTYAVFALGLGTALLITAWATANKRPGARLACAGVGVCFATLIGSGLDFMDGAFFPAFAFLIATILISLGLQTRERERRYALARATAARLEAELLKKHLQPHFLMNTLTSVLEWVETDPAAGARAIEALARELRSLTEVSGESLIEMHRELTLCRAHLEVMSYRRAVTVQLDSLGVHLEALVPPAVIHTLVENALTHNAYTSGQVTLQLRELRVAGRRQLTLRAPLANPEDRRAEGGGLRYVRARLEEAFPGQWELSSRIEEGDWVTLIDLPTEHDAHSHR